MVGQTRKKKQGQLESTKGGESNTQALHMDTEKLSPPHFLKYNRRLAQTTVTAVLRFWSLQCIRPPGPGTPFESAKYRTVPVQYNRSMSAVSCLRALNKHIFLKIKVQVVLSVPGAVSAGMCQYRILSILSGLILVAPEKSQSLKDCSSRTS